jgi:hypothetical protein
MFGYGDIKGTFPTDSVAPEADIPFYDADNIPVFFGHYWLTGTPKLQQNNVCCVDYSAGRGGNLVCYSHENPKDCGLLNVNNFKL